MQLEKRQFDILSLLAVKSGEKKNKITQREISSSLNCSLGTVNKCLRELAELGYVSGSTVTQDGIAALEPYRAKRAVFLAAGVGSRLMPVSLNTPKPMVRVNGLRMIDGLIDAVLDAGIDEITVVRGYLSEQFDQLLYKYPMIKFIENPYYNESNNISSALCAKDILSCTYVFESDLILHRSGLIRKYHYSSDFLGIKKDRSDDWCFDVRDGHIREEKLGGYDCYQMVGISYWNAEDGKKLASHIKEAYGMPGGRERFWEQVPLTVFNEEYNVEVIECRDGDVTEIDTLRELKEADKAYSAL